MNNTLSFYQNHLENGKIELKKATQTSFILSMTRLAIFVLTIFLAWYFSPASTAMAITIVSGIVLFLMSVRFYQNARDKKRFFTRWNELIAHEIRFLEDGTSDFSGGEMYITEDHKFAKDIDLFGVGSFFNRINRTELAGGEKYLAQTLGENSIEEIQQRQEAIQELSEKYDWRQRFQVMAALIDKNDQVDPFVRWMKKYQPVIPGVFKILPLVFGIVSFALLIICTLNLLSFNILLYWGLLGLGITSVFLKRFVKIGRQISELARVFQQYAELLHLIETTEFKAELLRLKQESIQNKGEKASEIFRKLSREINNFDQGSNLVASLPLNGLFLWNLRAAYQIEKWLTKNAGTVEEWTHVLDWFDAFNSLGNYAFNHPSFIYAQLTENQEQIIESRELGHPMLNPAKRIDNDILISKDQFFIVTGANMAGKSTFLRTVSLSIVCSNVGLPVCAKHFVYRPVKLISSMRTTDSLQKEESYFFSELKRLKFIIDALQKEEYFIVLDEILKGTNSKDKAEGSQKFVEKLVATGSTGIIATHDLSLCELESKLTQCKNYYFDAQIIQDELHFDYKFKKGICQNMNASFLLKKMEIVD